MVPSARRVQTKKKAPLGFAISPTRQDLGPVMWRIGHGESKQRSDEKELRSQIDVP